MGGRGREDDVRQSKVKMVDVVGIDANASGVGERRGDIDGERVDH